MVDERRFEQKFARHADAISDGVIFVDDVPAGLLNGATVFALTLVEASAPTRVVHAVLEEELLIALQRRCPLR